MIFVDTGAWFARFVPDDPDHDAVMECFVANSQSCITSDYCVDETLTLLQARKRHKLAAAASSDFFDGSLAALHFLSRSQIERASILFQQHVNSGWSFTDCTSKIVIDDWKLTEAVALDQHFHEFGVQVHPATA